MASSSSSSKRARIRFYNPKPLSQAPPNSDPFKSCTPFISDEIFDERKPIPPGDPKRSSELPSNWIMEEHVRKGGKYIGRKYMIFIEPVNGEHFKSLKGVRQHLGLPTKTSKQQDDKTSPKSTKPDPRQFPSQNLSNQEMKERAMSESQMMYPNALYSCQKDGDENRNSGLHSNPDSNSNSDSVRVDYSSIFLND